MSSVSDPTAWELVKYNGVFSFCAVASSAAVIYDWVLTFRQEFELIWRQRWTFITLLYLGIRYIGLIYSGIALVSSLPSISLTDKVGVSEIADQIEFLVQYNDLNRCTVLGFVQWRAFLIINAMLGVIMIIRLYAMYQRSRAMLIFLVIIFLAITVASGVIVAKQSSHISWQEIILFNTYHCSITGADPLAIAKSWILITVWEVLALCLAVWITVKHFRELRQSRTGSTIRDCFTVLIKSHVLYFAAFAAVACFNLGLLSPLISESFPAGLEIYNGILRIISLLQMFVLGPRLILTIREYHATLVNTSDEGTYVTTLAFREHSQVSTGDV